MVWEHTSNPFNCLFPFITSYIYDGSNKSTTLCAFFASSSSFGFSPAACCGGCCAGGGSSLNTNSPNSFLVASSSGVARPSVSGPPSPRCPFRSPSSLSRFQKGGERTRSCNTAFAKHILPVFASPRARRRGLESFPV